MMSGAPAAAVQPQRTTLTVRPWRESWRDAVESFAEELAVRGYSSFTIRDYRTDVMQLGGWVEVPLGQLERRHLAIAQRRLDQEGLSLAARRRRLSAYARFLAFLQERKAAISGGRLLLRLVADQPATDRMLVGLIALAGLRLTEIAKLEGRDLKLRKGVIATRAGLRLLPLHPWIREAAAALRQVVPVAPFRPVLPGLNGFPANARTLHCRFQRLAQAVELEELRPETLRRETAAHLRKLGTPAGLVTAFLGKDRGRPVAPRRGGFVDLTCLGERLCRIAV